jgi:hypothetical protein
MLGFGSRDPLWDIRRRSLFFIKNKFYKFKKLNEKKLN